MNKKKLIIIIISAILAAAIVGVGLFAIILFGGPKNTGAGNAADLNVYMADTYYFGTESFGKDGKVGKVGQNDLSIEKSIGNSLLKELNAKEKTNLEKFNLADFEIKSSNSSVIEVKDGNFKIKKAGKTNLSIKYKGENFSTKKVEVIVGVNASDFKEFSAAIWLKKAVFLHSDLLIKRLNSKECVYKAPGGDYNSLKVYNSIYGNGYHVTGHKTFLPVDQVKGNLFFVDKSNVTIQDLEISGYDFNNDDVKAQTKKDGLKEGSLLIRTGNLININSWKGRILTNVTVKNCILENGHKLIHMSASKDIKIEGCIFRNASDTGISIGSSSAGKTTLTVKNNMLTNCVAGAIVNYCMDKNFDPAKDTCEITIEGFLDCYKWIDVTKEFIIMPPSDDLAPIGNKAIGQGLKDKKNFDLLYKGKYLHVGIMALSSTNFQGKKLVNRPKIIGLDKIGFEHRPVPGGDKVLCNCDIYGYLNDKQMNVNDVFGSDKKAKTMYNDLRNGRK